MTKPLYPIQVVARLGDIHTARASSLQQAASTIQKWSKDPSRTLSERATAGAVLSHLAQQIHERVHGTVDLHNPRASSRITARSR